MRLLNTVAKRSYMAALFALVLAACSQAPKQPMPNLTNAQTQWIGEQIFANECSLKTSCLTSWNEGEDFPSLGIGHFIWYRQNQNDAFVESFPALLDYYDARGLVLPEWLNALPERAAPWQSKAQFDAEFDSARLSELREYLYATRATQAQFIIARMQASLPALLEHTAHKEQLRALFYEIANDTVPLGMYALIDYVNFKGEGTAPTERYAGQGWGLLQVLETLSQTRDESALMPQFAKAARTVLAQRVANAPPQRNEQRWINGWNNRTRSYEALP